MDPTAEHLTMLRAALPWAVAGYGIIALLVGYVIGSSRTFAYCDYHYMSWIDSLRTLLPHFGRS